MMFHAIRRITRLMLSGVLLTWFCAWQVSVALGMAARADESAKQQTEAGVLRASNRAVTRHKLTTSETTLTYSATAASLTVTGKEAKPVGRIFYISYTAHGQPDRPRPLTFVFNGGPGAASAYLHMGALGPKQVEFENDGKVPPMPARLRDNAKSWLVFTDLVFVDPVGTGYSREIEGDADNGDGQKSPSPDNTDSGKRTWGVEEDADSLARFIRAYLTKERRWLSPLYLAGESYGGFRVARLSKLLQSDFGIAPNGLMLISPALDFGLLRGNERSLWPWVAMLPSYTAVAALHGRAGDLSSIEDNPRAGLGEAETFSLSGYLTGLADGGLKPGWLEHTSRLMGLDSEIVARWHGRVPPARFVKALLADRRRLVSLYDGSILLIDPDPSRQLLAGGDPYLDRLNAPVTAAFNSYVRDHLEFETRLPYLLLNEEVSKSWNWHSGIQGQQGYVEVIDDLKQAMSLNPDMRVLILHGVFDLVTPYYGSVIAIKQMALDPAIRGNIQLKVYPGGHMLYFHRHSLDTMYEDTLQFYSHPDDGRQVESGQAGSVTPVRDDAPVK